MYVVESNTINSLRHTSIIKHFFLKLLSIKFPYKGWWNDTQTYILHTIIYGSQVSTKVYKLVIMFCIHKK